MLMIFEVELGVAKTILKIRDLRLFAGLHFDGLEHLLRNSRMEIRTLCISVDCGNPDCQSARGRTGQEIVFADEV
jgi:hypothetical protein